MEILELRNKLAETNSVDGFKGKLETAEEQIDEGEGKAIEDLILIPKVSKVHWKVVSFSVTSGIEIYVILFGNSLAV